MAVGNKVLRVLKISLIALLVNPCSFAWSLTPENAVAQKDYLPTKSDAMTVSDEETEKAILQIDRQVAMICVNLARFNIHFRLKANYHSPSRDWRYPLGQEAGTAACFAGTIVDLDQRAKGLSNLNNISISARKNAICSTLVGNSIRGTSSLIELGENSVSHLHAWREGFSPEDSIAFVRNKLDQAEALLLQRQKLVDSVNSVREKQLFELHNLLFRQMLDQLLQQFMKWSTNSREVAWREDTFYALNAAQNYILVASSILGRASFSNPQARSSSIVTSLIGNSISTVNPIFRTMAGVAIRKYQRQYLRKTFAKYRPTNNSDWQIEWKNLKERIPEEHSPNVEEAIAELSFLGMGSKELDNMLDAETARIQKLRRVAAQQAISGPLIGLTSLSRSILSAVAHYDYPTQPKTRNQLLFAGLIPQAAGQAYALVNTPTAAIMNMRYKKKLAKKGELPQQVLRRRLDSLDKLESQLKTEHPWIR